jgi:hypothetical protein
VSKNIFSQTETAERLGHQVLRDAVAAGWIKPRALKPGRTKRKAAKVIFAGSDIDRVERRILEGEYPSSAEVSDKT